MEVILTMQLKNYKELIVWQKAYQLCLEIYKITKRFPKSEVFGLSYDLKRTVISILSNIAEGYGRQTTKEYIRFLYIAYGSYCELETKILLIGDLDYINKEEKQRLLSLGQEVERMLKALINSLEKKIT